MNYGLIFSTGLIFLAALALSGILRKFKIPSVTSYIFMGIILGPLVSGVISKQLLDISHLVSTLALSIIAFSLGQNFSRETFAKIGKDLLALSLGQSLGAVILVGFGIYILTGDVLFSLAISAIPAATSPTSVVMVVRELNIKGKFPQMLMGTVALSNLWGILIFALILAVIRSAGGSGGSLPGSVGAGIIEILGAVILGLAMGWALSFFSGMITHKSELLILTLGFIFFTTGLALALSLSALLASMAMSATVTNINPTSFKFFNSLREVDSPLYLLFFVLAGAKLELTGLGTLGLVGAVYILTRLGGKIAGVYIGAVAADLPARIRGNLGIALSPQAGVALGLAIVLASAYPDPAGGQLLLSTVVATTVLFEIFGPLLTRYALLRNSGH